MNKKILFGILGSALALSVAVSAAAGLSAPDPGRPVVTPSDGPIVVIIADKLNSLELFNSPLPAVRKFLSAGACGLMNIRSGKKYSDTGSGYLTLGSGGRSAVDPNFRGACEPDELIPGGAARSYLQWSLNWSRIARDNPVIPEIGLLQEQAKTSQFVSTPGMLGEVFRENGWKTCLIGNLDNGVMPETSFRPGGFLLMNRRGVIDEGSLNGGVVEDRFFPFQKSFSVPQSITALKRHLGKKKLIAVEFGDFYRLDAYQTQILPQHYQVLKTKAWNNFNQFMENLLPLQTQKNFSLLLVSPSVSQDSRYQGNLLAPVVIRAPGYPPGLLTSGTTKWRGLVANSDFLPTLVQIGGIHPKTHFTGRVMVSRPAPAQPSGNAQELVRLNQRLIRFYLIQRPLLNWYMGIITLGWLGGLVCLLRRKKKIGSFLITFVMTIPLILILFPLFPAQLWSIPCFMILASLVACLLTAIPDAQTRVLTLTGLIWGLLAADQITGWNLIRYSALGYSAVDGSRYYGMGNEYMGIFLAAALIFAHLIHQTTGRKWPVWAVLGATIGILSLPQFGAKFGGILSGTVGIAYYLIHLHRVNLRNKKLWMVAGGFGLVLITVGWWDSIRPPEIQTHIGRFIRLFWLKDFSQITTIIFRKLNMNLKLTLASQWMRITLLALGVGLCYRIFTPKKLLLSERDRLIWRSLLATGIAAYLVNDAGVLALATCMAYGFSYLLLRFIHIDAPDVLRV